MKAIIFAGGVGTRLWPLSRKNSPKQFEKVIGDKSTLQLAVERLTPDFKWSDIYIATSDRYVNIIKGQLPKLPKENIIGEPATRDVGPAVGLVVSMLEQKNPHEPIVILWSDHLVKKEDQFRKILKTAEYVIKEKKSNLVFITQKARFASQNLGWIEYSKEKLEKDNIKVYGYERLIYRPTLDLAEKFLKSGHHAWNVGYFVTTPSYLWEQYNKFQPKLFKGLKVIQSAYGSEKFDKTLKEVYPTLEKISFDDAILSKIDSTQAVVISENLEWSDVGAWEALKEALQKSPEQTVAQGKVLLNNCRDSLIYNYTDQMVVALDLDGLLVVNTHDVIMICHKNSVPKIKKLVESLSGSENEHLT